MPPEDDHPRPGYPALPVRARPRRVGHRPACCPTRHCSTTKEGELRLIVVVVPAEQIVMDPFGSTWPEWT